MEGKKLMAVDLGVPVKVPVPAVGKQVIGKDRWEFIHGLKAEGQSVSQIARITGSDRKTVRTCLAQPQWQPYRRGPTVNTLLGPHAAWLDQRAAPSRRVAPLMLHLAAPLLTPAGLFPGQGPAHGGRLAWTCHAAVAPLVPASWLCLGRRARSRTAESAVGTLSYRGLQLYR
jgi:hypothetical protein